MFTQKALFSLPGADAALEACGLKQEPQEELPLVHNFSPQILSHPLMQNAMFAMRRQGEMADSLTGLIMSSKLCLASIATLLTRYGDELYPDPSRYMLAPVVNHPSGHIITARARKLSPRLRLEALMDARSQHGQEAAEDEMISKLVDEVYLDFRTEINTIQGYFHPYVLLSSSGVVIDPATFQPVISFITRYGVSPV